VSKKAVDTKYKTILARERSMAKTVAVSLIKPKTLTVWEIMIPVIFILNYVKIKQSREVFIQNHLFTKELALKAVLDMVEKAQSRDAVMNSIKLRTKELVSTVPDGIYSNDIRRGQIKEIDILIDHYCKLFEADGEDYTALVVNAYGTREEYTAFLKQLKSAENDVVMAARRTLGDKVDLLAAGRLEELIDRVRAADVEKIF
jgi:Fe2+ transport system protein B